MNDEVYGEHCIWCNAYTLYDDLYVVDTIPDEDGYLVVEVVVCKDCYKERNYPIEKSSTGSGGATPG
jgi:hypothetical protein